MQQQGSIVRWDAARGFGFIRSASTQADVFFHVRDFRGAPEPALGMAVEYEEIHVGGKGPRAMAVRPRTAAQPVGSGAAQDATPHRSQRHTGGSTPSGKASQPSQRTPSHSSHPAAVVRSAHRNRSARRSTAPPSTAPATGAALLQLLVLGWLALLAWSLWNGLLPLWSVGALLALNLLTLWFYAADKNAARAGSWRVSERQLHLLHLLSLLGGWPAAWLAQQNLRHKTSKASFRAVYWLTIVLHCGALVLWLWRGPQALLF